jgi:nitrate reductase NapE component
MVESARLDKLEKSVRDTQDNILLMGKDIHQMSLNITSIASSMKSLVEVQQNMKIMDERNETRHSQLKEADRTIHKRLDELVDSRTKAEKGLVAYNIILFIAKTIGSVALITVFGIVIWAIQMKG